MSKLSTGEVIALLGASRGLGAQVARDLNDFGASVSVYSRKSALSRDFSKEEQWSDFIIELQKLNPERLLYFAGGGPFGPYPQKQWKDHLWSYRVNFLFPSFLLSHAQMLPRLKQIVFVGSAIAESRPDPGAASYAAGKAALWNLIRSIQQEKSLHMDLRLFSPGYLDTELLPPAARPRLSGEVILSPKAAAATLLEWIQASDDTGGHLVIKS